MSFLLMFEVFSVNILFKIQQRKYDILSESSMPFSEYISIYYMICLDKSLVICLVNKCTQLMRQPLARTTTMKVVS